MPYRWRSRTNKTGRPRRCSFRVSQNANGNAVMDPSHWVFSFGGMDVSGRSMDPGADQYLRGARLVLSRGRSGAFGQRSFRTSESAISIRWTCW